MIYPNYINDRKSLGYECLTDTRCVNQLVLITDSSVLLIRNLPLNVKRKSKRIVVFSNPKPTKAVGMPMPPSPQQELVVQQESSNRLIQESNVAMSVETQPKILLIKMKSDLKNSKWVEDWIVSLRGGEEVDENLIRSILSKVGESDLDVTSINKILLKLGDSILSIASNEKLLRFLSELEKPFESKLFDGQLLPSTDILGLDQKSKSSSSFFAEGLPRARKKEDFMNQLPPQKSSTPSAYSMFDSTRCYANREAYDMPREVIQRFESKAVSNLAKRSLMNPNVKKEYARIQERIEAGIHPVNIGKKSTFVSADKVLIKGGEGRYSWI